MIQLFKDIMKTGKGFKNYNFREFILRRAKEDFKEHENVSDPSL